MKKKDKAFKGNFCPEDVARRAIVTTIRDIVKNAK